MRTSFILGFSDIVQLLERARAFGLPVDVETTTFFVRHETLVPARISALRKWKRNLFIRIYRSAQDAPQFYQLPPGRVVALGSQTRELGTVFEVDTQLYLMGSVRSRTFSTSMLATPLPMAPAV